jgi:pimeloyl-ACP methyl ester carboxylesterase
MEIGEAGGIPVLRCGEGPVVILAHGWGGRPAQMAVLGRTLADQGFQAVIPTLPGRAGGEQTDIKQAAAALRAVGDDVSDLHAVVGHSFAAMVMRLAFAERAPQRVVLIAPALDVRDALDVFGERFRLFSWTRSGLRSRLRAWDKDLWPVVSDVHTDQMPGASMLILHDPADSESSFARAAQLAALRPDTHLEAIYGVGHHGILSDSGALDRVTVFVTEPVIPETKAG